MKHIIIGTAGHIDHGKTALIKALTGRNTDRLTEEQQRGITIDLGFTWFDLPDGTRCGIIDVPGHEKFISNMTAGVTGMDLVLMTVAANEGIMPQTLEHLDILELLGVRHAILVFTKCDLADRGLLEMAEAEAKEQFKGTLLEHAPYAHVSSVTGEGIPELKQLIYDTIRKSVPERDVHSIPRLPVDRVFTMPGFGTIVTGTLLSGKISKGDLLQIYPSGKTARVRSLQVHEIDKEECSAGQRAALNLPNIKKEEISRGCVLAPEGSMRCTSLMDVTVKILSRSSRTVRNRTRLHLYTGTSRILCRINLLDHEELKAGESGFAQLVCESEIAVRRGDRFVVRFYSPLETVGGGVVLDSNPGKKKRFRKEDLEELKRKQQGTLLDDCELAVRSAKNGLISLSELSKDLARSSEELEPYLVRLTEMKAVLAFPLRKDTWYWHLDNEILLGQKLDRALHAFAEKNPYREGMPKAEIRQVFFRKLGTGVMDECLRFFEKKQLIRIHADLICAADFQIRKDAAFLSAESFLKDTFEKAGYQFVNLRGINPEGISEELLRDVLRVMIREGLAVQVSMDADYYTMKHFMDEAEKIVRDYFRREKVLTVIRVRELFDVSRKNAKLILEYLDTAGITRSPGAATERIACRPGELTDTDSVK